MNYPNRKTPRAQWHEYIGGEYFVTFCTKNRAHYFGKIQEGQMRLTPIGEFLKKQIENTEIIRESRVAIPLYVIMPNHVHLIVIIFSGNHKADARGASLQKFGPQSYTLGSIIRGIKSSVTHFANDNNINFGWQSRYHDHIIRDRNERNRIAKYIENNPVNWENQ